MLERMAAPDGPLPGRRASLRVGGNSIARHQLALALGLGCTGIVCIAAGFDAEINSLHRAAEAAGARFHVIPNALALVGLVTASDELIAFDDGLFAWPALATTMLADPAVVVQPVDAGVAAGFERLDLNHAAAGALRISGALVHRLAELPADCDALSALQRLALQSGVPQRLLTDGQKGGIWALVRSEAEAHGAEAAWIRLHTSNPGGAGRGGAAMRVARGAVRAFGPALLHGGSRGAIIAAAAAVMLLLALVGGWFGLVTGALVAVAVAVCGFAAAALLDRVARLSFHRRSVMATRPALPGWLVDAALLALLTWRERADALSNDTWTRGFAALMLLGQLRLAPHLLPARWGEWLADRAVLALLLALAAAIGMLTPAVAVLALALLAAGLLRTGRPRLTPA